MVKPEDCMVIEDSTIGLAAAKAALMSCIVTKSTVTSVLPGLCSPESICACVLVWDTDIEDERKRKRGREGRREGGREGGRKREREREGGKVKGVKEASFLGIARESPTWGHSFVFSNNHAGCDGEVRAQYTKDEDFQNADLVVDDLETGAVSITLAEGLTVSSKAPWVSMLVEAHGTETTGQSGQTRCRATRIERKWTQGIKSSSRWLVWVQYTKNENFADAELIVDDLETGNVDILTCEGLTQSTAWEDWGIDKDIQNANVGRGRW
jgi:hypothetical protein